MSLKQMQLFPEDEAVIDQIVAFIDSKEKVHLLPIPITKELLKESMNELENYLEKSNCSFLLLKRVINKLNTGFNYE